MNAEFPRKQTFGLWLAAVLLALPVWTHAQDLFPTPTPTPDPLAGVPVQVLDQQQVTIGTHTITFNRIAPPVFPPATSTPKPQPTPTTNTTNRTPQAAPARRTASRSPQTRAQKANRSAQNNGVDEGEKPYKILFLSATVYDHQFTALRFYGGGSPELSAYVNIDFNYFRGVDQIETADAYYTILFGMGDDTVAALTQAGQQPPNLSAFPAGRSSYQIIAGDATAHAADLAALDTLCGYYDASSAQMIAAYNQQQAYNAAYQQWMAAHPQPTPNTVINYWPTKSQVYLPTGR